MKLKFRAIAGATVRLGSQPTFKEMEQNVFNF